MLAPPLTSSFARELIRPIGLGHGVLGVAFALIWVHLLDAAFVHPQANATILEHVLQGLLALFVLPAGFALYPRIRRVERAGAVDRGHVDQAIDPSERPGGVRDQRVAIRRPRHIRRECRRAASERSCVGGGLFGLVH